MASTGSLDAEPLSLPFQGSTLLSRHCSAEGAKSAAERCGRQAVALLALYRSHGPLTDAQAADAMGIERTSINARRNALVKLGLVEAYDTVKNDRSGISNTRWQLATSK
jgi:predicted ArsR family transcriptional regulator